MWKEDSCTFNKTKDFEFFLFLISLCTSSLCSSLNRIMLRNQGSQISYQLYTRHLIHTQCKKQPTSSTKNLNLSVQYLLLGHIEPHRSRIQTKYLFTVQTLHLCNLYRDSFVNIYNTLRTWWLLTSSHVTEFWDERSAEVIIFKNGGRNQHVGPVRVSKVSACRP